MVTAYTSPPAPTGTLPGAAIVEVEPEPKADLCANNAESNTGCTPVNAEIVSPPSVTGERRNARTTKMLSPQRPAGGGLAQFGSSSLNPSGKFRTFVARYVAIVIPSVVTESTSLYVLPTGVPLVW